jgi:ditrans,polycis-polyprenyl diphosphate synthase
MFKNIHDEVMSRSTNFFVQMMSSIVSLMGRICVLIASVCKSLLSKVLKHLSFLIFGEESETHVELSLFEKCVILPILRNCKIPEHVGFIMDGNRRFARTKSQPTLHGHRMGYTKLRRVLLWCFEIGVREVSVFAFSVDNFSRSADEIQYMMDLAVEKLGALAKADSFVMQQGIRVRICGERSLLRQDLVEIITDLESKTQRHSAGVFNILLAYSSKRELQQAVSRTHIKANTPILGVWDNVLSNMYVQTPLDLVVRTSGETRLSDFLIWQIQPNKTLVIFESNFWPNYSLRDFAKNLIRYNYFRS